MTKKNLRISMLSFFYIALVLHGLHRMCGLFVIELSKTKNITRQDAAVPFIYSWAVAKIISSFSHFLIDSKSSDLIVYCGVLLCTIGAALCILDIDVTSITVFWGFLFGSGYGLATPYLTRLLKNVDLSKRLFLMEVSSSFGISIMPFLSKMLISQYGLQGSCILFSGVILQYIPLALAAAYNIEIRIPNIKWGVRKKSSQYSVSKHEGEKTTSIESFSNSLEPDFILNMNQCDDCHKINTDSSAIFSKDKLPVGRKRSETKSNDLQEVETDRKMLHKHKTHLQIIPERENCEKMFEKSFSNMNLIAAEIECKGHTNLSTINSEVIHNIYTNISNTSKPDFSFKNKILENIFENEIKQKEGEKKKLKGQFLEDSILNDKNILTRTCVESTKSFSIDSRKDCSIIKESPETENGTSFTSKQTEDTSHLSHKFQYEKLLNKEIPDVSTRSLQSTCIFTNPLEIKVYVEEYTFTVDKEYRNNSFDSNYSEDRISNGINYLKSRFFEGNEYLNSANQNIPRNILNDFDNKANLPDIYSISNNPKFQNKKISSKRNNKAIDSNISKDKIKLSSIRLLKFLNKILSPICLCTVVITIIFETSLITLLTNVDDIQNSTDHGCSDFKWILVSFGVGGLFGKLCCFKISKTISEKSHTVGIILFLLTGLSIAGVLYSPNLNWIAGFYSILGALEGGISCILPKFVLDYTHKEVHQIISSMQNFLSGVAIICLPSVIGLLPGEMGDYEFLLQTFSCLSILCAFLAYFLPYLRSISAKRIFPSFKEKIARV